MDGKVDEKVLIKYGLTAMDFAYLTDEQKAIFEMEIARKRVNLRVMAMLKRFASVSKSVEGITSYLKGYDMDTRAMQWIREMYSATPPSSGEYKLIESVILNYTKVQIWLGNFFSLVNSFNHSMNLRRLSSAEKTLKKMELEIAKGRRVFKEFNASLKNLKNHVMGEREEEKTLLYFT